MIDSINPRNLLDFAIEVANWTLQRSESLETELDDVLRVINTFCTNSDDPIYQGAYIFAEVCIKGVIDINAMMQETTNEPELIEKTEVKEDNGVNSTDAE